MSIEVTGKKTSELLSLLKVFLDNFLYQREESIKIFSYIGAWRKLEFRGTLNKISKIQAELAQRLGIENDAKKMMAFNFYQYVMVNFRISEDFFCQRYEYIIPLRQITLKQVIKAEEEDQNDLSEEDI